MALKALSGEIKSQDINDNLSYLEYKASRPTAAMTESGDKITTSLLAQDVLSAMTGQTTLNYPRGLENNKGIIYPMVYTSFSNNTITNPEPLQSHLDSLLSFKVIGAKRNKVYSIGAIYDGLSSGGFPRYGVSIVAFDRTESGLIDGNSAAVIFTVTQDPNSTTAPSETVVSKTIDIPSENIIVEVVYDLSGFTGTALTYADVAGKKFYNMTGHRDNYIYDVSKWTGKTWIAIGDSITEVNATATKKYYDYIAEKTGCTVDVEGVSGSGYIVSSSGTDAIHQRIAGMSNGDLITVFAGTNDWWRTDVTNKPLGVYGDTTVETFYGALDYTFNALINKYPTKTIAVFTPLQRNNVDSLNTGSKSLEHYADAIVKVANKYSLPVLDLYRNGNFYARNSTFNTTFMPDGLHPNNAGHQRIADKVLAFINSL